MTRWGNICKKCGRMAINPHRYGRDPSDDLDLCDVCYWRKRAEARQWQPIETSPKDGTVIDLWVPPRGRMTDYRYDNEYSDSGGMWCKYHSLVAISDGRPTHWMPLPDPPKDGK